MGLSEYIFDAADGKYAGVKDDLGLGMDWSRTY